MALYLVLSFQGANTFAKLAFVFLFVALLVGWVSYCTASWGRVAEISGADPDYVVGYGIWRVSDNQFQNLNTSATSGHNGPVPQVYSPADGWLLSWYGAFQACATLGFVCLHVGFLLVTLFVFVGPCKVYSELAIWNAINNFVGSLFWLIAVIVFGSKFDDDFKDSYNADKAQLHYSFVLAICAFILQLASGIVLLFAPRGGRGG